MKVKDKKYKKKRNDLNTKHEQVDPQNSMENQT